jgi:hypothetical protein
MSSFSAFGKELYYGTLLFCSGRWEVCHLRSEDISLYIRCLLSALQPWRGRARADDFWMRLRYGMPDPERMTRVVESWIAVQMLCHLNSGPVAVRVFRRRYPWLGEELERDDIWLIQRGFFFGRFSDSYVDAPYGKGFVVAMALIGCFHMSGLFVRRFECRWP